MNSSSEGTFQQIANTLEQINMVIAKFSIPIVSVIGIILTTVAIISILTKKTK